ncbi:hypothetical protein Y027_5665 [Burkholderia pseudomallei TSV5]|nr:hypothetical protein X948_5089 [Burkholderia pseudomallei MSHR5608]KGS74576.1 hypothetical protein X942_5437 [Burkholderia pseudomallei MSHR5596]KGX49658.1 hypothetical protein Y027_5665 [Burkholderia pseudomallei TSV5]
MASYDQSGGSAGLLIAARQSREPEWISFCGVL